MDTLHIQIWCHILPSFFHRGIGVLTISIICAHPPPPRLREITPDYFSLLCYYLLYLLGKLFDVITRHHYPRIRYFHEINRQILGGGV